MLLLAVSCGGADGDEAPIGAAAEPLTIAEAIAARRPGPVQVRAYLLAASGQPYRLCSSLAESHPPQCGRPSLRLDDLDLEHISGLSRAADGSSWTDEPLSLNGIVRGGALVIEEPHR